MHLPWSSNPAGRQRNRRSAPMPTTASRTLVTTQWRWISAVVFDALCCSFPSCFRQLTANGCAEWCLDNFATPSNHIIYTNKNWIWAKSSTTGAFASKKIGLLVIKNQWEPRDLCNTKKRKRNRACWKNTNPTQSVRFTTHKKSVRSVWSVWAQEKQKEIREICVRPKKHKTHTIREISHPQKKSVRSVRSVWA